MAHSSSQSILVGGLFGDPELAVVLADEAAIARMVQFERGLAKVQGALGVIPAEAARAIDEGLDGFSIPPAELADGMATDGVVVPALVKSLRRALPPDAGQWLHWGATSQDVVDTGLVLGLRDCLDILASRLALLIDKLRRSRTATRTQ